MDILRLIYFAIQGFSNAMVGLVSDYSSAIIVVLVIFLISGQYRNLIGIQRQMYGGRIRYKLRDFVSTSILAGILAGLVGSIVITVMGITFQSLQGLWAVIILSLLLMFFVNPRYVCLSYSGGILGLLSLIFTALISRGLLNSNDAFIKYIQGSLGFDVTALMAVVAIMHLMEAVLMWFDGSRGAVPVFMKREGRLVGGFIMQRFWIIPILFYVLSTVAAGDSSQNVATPSWWPIFGPNLPREVLKNSVFAAMPLLAMLGYSDFSMSTPVVRKVRRSAAGLLCFSIILLCLAFLSNKLYIFKYIAVLFAPLAHEGLILFERYRETTAKPLWAYSEDGIIVVDTLPGSPAEKLGVKSGDKIVSINNNPTNSIEDVSNVLGQYLTYIWIEVIDMHGIKKTFEYNNYSSGVNGLGIITVPKEEKNVMFVEESSSSFIRRMKDKFRK